MKEHMTPPESGRRVKKTLKEVMADVQAASSEEVRRELVGALYNQLKSDFEQSGGIFFEDINAFYRSLDRQHAYLVRREQPQVLAEAVMHQEDINLNFDPSVGDVYANSAEWKPEEGPRGLDNAFLEGHAQVGGIAMIMGFDAGEDVQMHALPKNAERLAAMDRSKVRSISGSIHAEDLRFAILRVPAKYLPEGALTDDEIDRMEESDRPVSAFRAFLLNTKEAKRAEDQSAA